MNVVASLALVAIGLVVTPELLVGFGVAAALGTAIETLAPLHRSRRPRRIWLLDLTHAFGNRAMIVPLVALAAAVLGPVADAVTPSAERWPAVVHVVVVLLASDLANYGVHRALHRVPRLWRFHAVHHSSEQLDWLATARVHPLDLALNITVVALPAYALGQPQLAPWAVAAMSVQPFLIHADVRLRLPWLAPVLVTPAFHHWHHAADAEAHDRNFGMFLSLWDHLFGTALVREGAPAAYGVTGSPLASADYLGQLTIPFRGRRARARRPRPQPPCGTTRRSW